MFSACSDYNGPRIDRHGTGHLLTPTEALERLQEGNRRFAAGTAHGYQMRDLVRRKALAAGQAPFAIIVGCSDSRVPAEIIFDQGLGDLFVIRVAGNVVAPSQIGSVEYAAARFGTPLVVVLGHSQCGAVLATLEELGCPGHEQSESFGSIVDRIRPAVEGLMSTELARQPERLVHEAVRANIRMASDRLRSGSDSLERLVCGGTLTVVGAEYSLDTGLVEFFDGVPAKG